MQILQEEQGTLTITANNVKVSFFHSPYVFSEEMTELSGVPVAGLVDIASMKVLAISQHGAKRDFVDLYFILQEIPFTKIALNMIERFGANRVNPVVIGKALVYFHDAESDPEPEYLTKKKDWKTIKKFFIDHVQQFVIDIHKETLDILSSKNEREGIGRAIEEIKKGKTVLLKDFKSRLKLK